MFHVRPLLSAFAVLFALAVVPRVAHASTPAPASSPAATVAIALPAPDLTGKVTLEHALATRRSTREYAPGALTLAQAGQILWAAHGVTSPDGKRTTPSAHAVYPLTVYAVVNEVTGLAPGVYRYEPKGHALTLLAGGDHKDAMTAVTVHEPFVGQAPLVVVVAGDTAYAATKLGPHAEPWIVMEAGFVVQDVYLEATALGLGSLMVGSFDPAKLRETIGLPATQVPYAVMPVGGKK